jgi:phosphoserine phosphatase RsbU/P
MSTLSVADLKPLPAPVVRLLDGFGAAHAGCVRLWAEDDAGVPHLLYPAGTDGVPAGGGVRIDVREGPRLRLELTGGGREVTAFLADTLARVFDYEREAQSAARELTERYEEINLLYSISEILGSVISLESAASRILGEVVDVLGVRRAAIWVHAPEDNVLNLAAAVGEEGIRGPIQVEDPHSVTARVFRDRQPLNLERGTVLPRPQALEPNPGREAFLSVPINFTPPDGQARTVGVVTLIGSRTHERFTAGDARLLSAIASQIGAALENQRLVQASLRRQRMEREMELAHDLQLKLLPDVAEFQGTFELAARCVPADSVGGDFYHFFRLSGDRLGVVIGDVSSHGFPAALIMALTMSAVAIYAQEAGPPAEVLRRVHGALIGELETTEMYLTLFYGVLDPRRGTLTYSNAGHPHAFAVGGGGGYERLGATSLPLGMAPLAEYGEGSISCRAGEDLLFLFTDGLSDPFFHQGEAGEKRLVEEVARQREKSPREILPGLFELAASVALDVPPDDRTAVLVRF